MIPRSFSTKDKKSVFFAKSLGRIFARSRVIVCFLAKSLLKSRIDGISETFSNKIIRCHRQEDRSSREDS
jgi:hypothetical protein